MERQELLDKYKAMWGMGELNPPFWSSPFQGGLSSGAYQKRECWLPGLSSTSLFSFCYSSLPGNLFSTITFPIKGIVRGSLLPTGFLRCVMVSCFWNFLGITSAIFVLFFGVSSLDLTPVLLDETGKVVSKFCTAAGPNVAVGYVSFTWGG